MCIRDRNEALVSYITYGNLSSHLWVAKDYQLPNHENSFQSTATSSYIFLRLLQVVGIPPLAFLTTWPAYCNLLGCRCIFMVGSLKWPYSFLSEFFVLSLYPSSATHLCSSLCRSYFCNSSAWKASFIRLVSILISQFYQILPRATLSYEVFYISSVKNHPVNTSVTTHGLMECCLVQWKQNNWCKTKKLFKQQWMPAYYSSSLTQTLITKQQVTIKISRIAMYHRWSQI